MQTTITDMIAHYIRPRITRANIGDNDNATDYVAGCLASGVIKLRNTFCASVHYLNTSYIYVPRFCNLVEIYPEPCQLARDTVPHNISTHVALNYAWPFLGASFFKEEAFDTAVEFEPTPQADRSLSRLFWFAALLRMDFLGDLDRKATGSEPVEMCLGFTDCVSEWLLRVVPAYFTI